jgi:hypothetical protein
VHVIASDRTDTVVAAESTLNRDRAEDVEAADKTAVDLANTTLSYQGAESHRRTLADGNGAALSR